MWEIKPIKDFVSSEYYGYYNKRIQDYSVKIINTIMESQWIEDEKKYTWNDVLKEVFKFVNGKLKRFPEDPDLNPTHTEYEAENLKTLIEESAKQYLGMN
jgi:hypothetical protein